MRTALPRSARAPEQRAQRRDHRVAGAGHIEDFARLRPESAARPHR